MAGSFVLYGECEFTTTQRRNQAANSVRNAATNRGLTAQAYGQYPAGVVNATLHGNPGFTVAYSAPDIRTAEQTEADANGFLTAQQYEGWVAFQEV